MRPCVLSAGRLATACLFLFTAAAAATSPPPDPVPADAAPAAAQSSAAAWLAGGQPAALAAAIERHNAILANGGWPRVDTTQRLRAGMRDPAVRDLRRRLIASGDYTATMGADPLFFDRGLDTALRRFQARNGLYVDGTTQQQTLLALNQSVAARIAQLRHARDAWATLPAADAGRRVWVNIPEATITALDNGVTVLQMPAVVGHPSRPTPELTSAIRTVVVNPSWTAPPTIAADDLVPRQIADAEFFARRGFDVYADWSASAAKLDPAAIDWTTVDRDRFPYRIRQRPGPANSLGRFKFEFPNEHDVYLHDTPVQSLLGLSVRSLSSGCVRAGDPRALAGWLLPARAAALEQASGDPAYRTRWLPVAAPVPVNLVYLLAWVAADGTVNFRTDLYGKAALPAAATGAR